MIQDSKMALITYIKLFLLEIILNLALYFIEQYVSVLEFVIIKTILKNMFKALKERIQGN